MISKQILKNTMMLYFRQILLMFVSLYSVRVVLDTLGVEEFGIYSVVAGIVTLCSFLSGSMASATQRFFSFALGKNDKKLLNATFSTNVLIYIAIALLAIVLLEVVGFWFVEHHLNVPSNRTEAAITLYHYTVISFFFTIIMAPFISIIVAHEDMHYFALISIIEALLKLAVVIMLVYLPGDKLEIYGLLLLFVSAITALMYAGLCFKKYDECQLRVFNWDSKLLKETLAFTGWTLFGQVTTAARIQAVTILLNQFFNPSVAAARAIAITISSKINIFSNNFNTGLYPPIVKSYANGNKDELFSLLFNGSKLTFFLMWIFVLPLMIEMETVLKLWLTILPEQVVLFSKLALVESLILSICLPITTAARAPGKMKVYELTLGMMQFSMFALAYLVLKLDYPAYSVFVVAIVVCLLMFVVRLILVSRLIGLPKIKFIREVCLPSIFVVIISSAPSLGFNYLFPNSLIYSMINIFISMFMACLAMYYIGLNVEWRNKIKMMISNKIKKNRG